MRLVAALWFIGQINLQHVPLYMSCPHTKNPKQSTSIGDKVDTLVYLFSAFLITANKNTADTDVQECYNTQPFIINGFLLGQIMNSE